MAKFAPRRTTTPTPGGRVVGLVECCALLGISRRTANRLLAQGTFPIPEMPRITNRHRFSTLDIDWYINHASTDDVQVARR
jgi:predicted DNA-binding transcriptional regulator AlpA